MENKEYFIIKINNEYEFVKIEDKLLNKGFKWSERYKNQAIEYNENYNIGVCITNEPGICITWKNWQDEWGKIHYFDDVEKLTYYYNNINEFKTIYNLGLF